MERQSDLWQHRDDKDCRNWVPVTLIFAGFTTCLRFPTVRSMHDFCVACDLKPEFLIRA